MTTTPTAFDPVAFKTTTRAQWQDAADGRTLTGLTHEYATYQLGQRLTMMADRAAHLKAFQAFAAGKMAILLEGDYFWRSVVEPLPTYES